MLVSRNAAQLFDDTLTLPNFDPCTDTPNEIIHTILLGIVEYVWFDVYQVMLKNNRLDIFGSRLGSTNQTGLSIPSIRAGYIIKYGKSLVGRHYKTLIQTAGFHLQDLISESNFTLWKATARLASLVWFSEINDMDLYLSHLKTAIANVMDLFGFLEPKRILDKVKIHLLCHLPEDIIRFGPAVGFSTERFESYNAVFRKSSIYSNRLNPSRDIAYAHSSQERMKYMLLGGFLNGATSEWKRAGYCVLNCIKHSPLLTTYGYREPFNPSPSLDQLSFPPNHHCQFKKRSVVSLNGNKCQVGSWVFAKGSNENTVVGVIHQILAPENSTRAFVILDSYEMLSVVDNVMELPQLSRQSALVILPSNKILFDFNTQPQEDRFLVNLHAIHNAHLLHSIIPRNLTAVKPAFVDRYEAHCSMASRLRRAQGERRMEQQAVRGARSQSRSRSQSQSGQDSRELSPFVVDPSPPSFPMDPPRRPPSRSVSHTRLSSALASQLPYPSTDQYNRRQSHG
ncbi:hypothetical protein ACJ73_10004 [Blastomyces percursus]|uniref:DUF4218 domain-containing protein n=1 Tax=Blastomyces percursus TaxID=1658174 RepID=A0A1J9PQ17_9EURO|nr:hypothetical protein ACJ73_10004 [Blastomyces percursus]